MRWTEHENATDRQEMHSKFYAGNLKNTLRRTGRNLKGNIKMDHKN